MVIVLFENHFFLRFLLNIWPHITSPPPSLLPPPSLYFSPLSASFFLFSTFVRPISFASSFLLSVSYFFLPPTLPSPFYCRLFISPSPFAFFFGFFFSSERYKSRVLSVDTVETKHSEK